MLSLLVGAYLTNEEYVTQATYTTFAFFTGLAPLIEMNGFFRQYYELESGIIIDPEGEPVSVLYFGTTWWPYLAIFSLTDSFICGTPCAILTFPE